MKKYLLLKILVLLGLGVIRSFAQTEETADRTLSPYFLVNGSAPGVDQLPLKSTAARVNIAGVIADVVVTQTYVNTGKTPLEAIYVFPGSSNAAVYGMAMQVGRRTITAKIAERQQAREQYEQAKTEGKRAALLEQERPNVFQMNVANILPGDTVRVVMRYTELLVPEEGVYQFVHPTVVGPRYTNGRESRNNGYTNQPYTHSGQSPRYDFDLSVHLATGMPIKDVHCATHAVRTDYNGLAEADIRLQPTEKSGGNRDFILRYSLRGDQIETGLLLYDDGAEKFFLCLAHPPKQAMPEHIPPREYIFVVDVSGSMNGFPLDISKKLLRNLIAGLQPQDRFNVLLFAGTSNLLSNSSLPANAANVEQAVAFIDRQEGSGGTELISALQRGLNLPRETEGMSRTILVITDGYVDVEPEAFDLVRNNLNRANLFAFGIGPGVNRHLIEGLAHVGVGTPFIVDQPEGADAAAEKFRKYVSGPVMTRLSAQFDGFEVYDVEPVSLPDVMSDRPVVLFGKWRGAAKGTIRLEGYSGAKPLSLENAFQKAPQWLFGSAESRRLTVKFDVSKTQPDARNMALKYLWARERIKYLDDYNGLREDPAKVAEVTRLGLAYNLLTAYTSFVAIEEVPANDNPGDLTAVNQPLPLPLGVSDMAIGFDLGIEGVSGLAMPGAGNGWLWCLGLALLGLGFGGLIWLGRRQMIAGRNLLLLIGLAAGLSACEQRPARSDADSVTFLLGEDRSGRNPYFHLAADYFKNDPVEKTDVVIDDCRTLREVRDYLAAHRPQNGPWSRVNLVVHGNQWTGMNVPVDHKTPRATAKAIDQAAFPALPGAALDGCTEIVVHGCNLGRDSALLAALSRAFGTADCVYPIVYSARYFNLFEQSGVASKPMQRYLADSRFVIFPSGQFPGNVKVACELEEKYPADTTDWLAALGRLQPGKLGESYVHYFAIPVRWTAVYPDSTRRPSLDNPAAQRQWIAAQTELSALLDEIGIAPEHFRWDFSPIDHATADGQTQPALFAEGWATVYCILQPLTTVENGQAVVFRPAVADERFYAMAQAGGRLENL